MNIAYVLGTRPEVIRSARILELLSANPSINLTITNTGQHYDDNMLGVFVRELGLPPITHDLGVGSANPAVQTAQIIERTSSTVDAGQQDCVCVFGDTNSTLGAALAAVKNQVPLVHIEAGCRSYDFSMPEEINRRAVDHMANLLLAVSPLAAENLRREMVLGEIQVVGDPQFDVFSRQSLPPIELKARNRGLITIHRQENADDPARLQHILREITAASEADAVRWLFPVHPRTRQHLADVPSSLELCDPLSYDDLLDVLFSSRACVTDSGGLQKEAFWARVPCVTVRRTTEWMETVWAGANVLAQPGAGLREAVSQALGSTLPTTYENPYGDGRASERVIEAVLEFVSR